MEVSRAEFREYNATTSAASAGTAANGVLKRLQFVLDTHVVEGYATSDDATVRRMREFIAHYRKTTIREVEEKLMGFADRKFDMDFPE